jgi:hypothetical protein
MILTKRGVLTAAGCLAGAAIVASLMRSGTGGLKSTMTTLFWVGEPSDADNDFIPNDVSYWDNQWQSSFGGVDDPDHRNGYWPAEFKPNENPFYVALPFGEFLSETSDELRADARNIPWYRTGLSPLLKNHWVEINRGDRTCYAQWEDVGPFEVDDFAFVFGSAKLPRNTLDVKAGLDVSPAVWHFLRMADNAETAWRFVDSVDVPPGPWTEIVTMSGNNRPRGVA